jgi:phage tail sheath protein FI
MADYVSPGVYTFEIDLSLYVPLLSTCICGVVGTASKGPIDQAQLITSWSQYVEMFGDVNPAYMMGYFVRSYFQWGNILYVVRVCEHDSNGNFLATSGYVNVFSNTKYPVTRESVGETAAGMAGPYTGTVDYTPVVPGSVIIQDSPISMSAVNESSTLHLELGVTQYSFMLNHFPVTKGSVIIKDDGDSPFETFTDDGNGNLVGDGSPAGTGTIDYLTGRVVINYGSNPDTSTPLIIATYDYWASSTETFTDDEDSPGILVGSQGGFGTIDYKSGSFSITFKDAPAGVGAISANYTYLKVTDGVLQLAAIWPGVGGNKLSFLVADGNKYLDKDGKTVLPVSEGGSSFRIQVYDHGQRTSLTFDQLSMYRGAKAFNGTSRFVEDVIGNKVFGEYGFKDSVTNNYVCARVLKSPTQVDAATTGISTIAGQTTYTFNIPNVPIVPGTVHIYPVINIGEQTKPLEEFVDDIDHQGVLYGTKTPAGTGSINYTTGAVSITFGTAPTVVSEILIDYSYNKPEMPYVGTNGYMFYIDPASMGVTPTYNYVHVAGTDAIDELQDSDVIGVFDSATNTRTGLQAFSDPETIDVNLIAAPGFSGVPVVSALITISEGRNDSMSLIDPPFGLSVQDVIDWHNGNLSGGVHQDFTKGDVVGYPTAVLNSSYAAMWWPWGKIYDARNSQYVWVPPSCGGITALAETDKVADCGKAPAGYNRGVLPAWIDIEYSPNQGERDMLYGNGNSINPIIKDPAYGITILGERTLYRQPTKLDRIHVRRLLLYMRKVIATAAKPLMFEPHDWKTWARFSLLVTPYLNFEVSRRNLYDFRVVCDSTTNTPYMIDNSTMVANIYVWPESAVERILINFVITPTSISFTEAYQIVQGASSGLTNTTQYVNQTGASSGGTPGVSRLATNY